MKYKTTVFIISILIILFFPFSLFAGSTVHVLHVEGVINPGRLHCRRYQ